MFEIKRWAGGNWYIAKKGINGGLDYLHSDGRVLRDCAEYYPSKEDAQITLDKFYPPPLSHEWKHGDVFKFDTGNDRGTMIYLETMCRGAEVRYISKNADTYSDLNYYLETAKFLFNIREKI